MQNKKKKKKMKKKNYSWNNEFVVCMLLVI